jgi:HD superfamily phosphohydrolase
MHTRFEHTLGVVHTATRMFDEVVAREERALSDLGYNPEGLKRDRIFIRLACLLHDLGHAPFSHASEELMQEGGKKVKHERYSGDLVRNFFADVIDKHPANGNYGFRASEIADFIENKLDLGNLQESRRRRFWRLLLDGHVDADRSDYLLRDSHHIGVEYGHYDLDRLIISLRVATTNEGDPVLCVDKGGVHAAVGVVMARYMMFSQVYFHHVRRAYDFHITEAMKTLLFAAQEKDDTITSKRSWPPPGDRKQLEKYVSWTDWRVLGALQNGEGGEHGDILRTRNHYRRAYETIEVPDKAAEDTFAGVKAALGNMVTLEDTSGKDWYDLAGEEILIREEDGKTLKPLSVHVPAIKGLLASKKKRLYVAAKDKLKAKELVEKFQGKEGKR